MIRTLMAVCRGAGHIEKNKPCQDAAKVITLLNHSAGIALAADGHGSDVHFRSGRGSVIAVNIAGKILSALIKKPFVQYKNYNNFEHRLKKAEKLIVDFWREAVIRDIAENPFTEKEIEICNNNQISPDEINYSAYGTTLLGSVITKYMYAVIQIGDGQCTLITRDDTKQAISNDPNCKMGITTSLASNKAENYFRHSFDFETVLGITVATDGVTDSFLPHDFLDFNYKFFEAFIQNPKHAEQELLAFLPRLSNEGSRDDCTLAGVFNINEAIKLLKQKKYNSEAINA